LLVKESERVERYEKERLFKRENVRDTDEEFVT
jgi:hypothetical protein